MSGITWVLAANIVIWLGIGGYVAFLAVNQRRIEQRLNILEDNHD